MRVLRRVAVRPVLGAIVALYVLALALLFTVLAEPAQAATAPAAAQAYRQPLRRQAQLVWGLGAPVAVFAAQVHQESRWRPDARSPVGASGLAQFMPATADWLGGQDAQLASRAPTNPAWALRALVAYDRWLWQRIPATPDACQRMAYVLSAYNGGLGWVLKRQALSAQPGQCLGPGGTCAINPGIRPDAQRENVHYPHVILQVHQPLYALWGPGLCADAGAPHG